MSKNEWDGGEGGCREDDDMRKSGGGKGGSKESALHAGQVTQRATLWGYVSPLDSTCTCLCECLIVQMILKFLKWELHLTPQF